MALGDSPRRVVLQASSAPDALPAFAPAARVSVQLEQGPLRVEACVQQGRAHRLAVGSVSNAMGLHGLVPPGEVVIAAVRAASGAAAWCGQATPASHWMVLGPGTPLALRLPAAARFAWLCVPAEVFSAICLSLGLRECRSLALGPGMHRFDTANPGAASAVPRRAALRRTARWLSLGWSVDLHAARWLSQLAGSLQAGWCDRQDLSWPRGRQQILRRAIEAMATAGSETSISDLARACGASQRGLEYAFQDFYQVSPSRFSKWLRLGAARSALKAGTTAGIADVARHLHFHHLGKFAADYAQHFGELPSETVRWSRPEPEATRAADAVIATTQLWRSAARLVRHR